MELKRIIISEIHEQQVIMLKEVDGERSFSIMIGIFEATSIDRRVKRLPSPRPLTHDLVASVIDSLGGELRDIYISELRDHTYYAKLRIRMNGEMVEVDSRPSDAIALAVTAGVAPEADVGEGVQVGPHVVIEGEVRVGAGCVLRPGCCLIGPLTLGRHNTVYSGAVLGERPQHTKYNDEPTRLEIGDHNIIRE